MFSTPCLNVNVSPLGYTCSLPHPDDTSLSPLTTRRHLHSCNATNNQLCYSSCTVRRLIRSLCSPQQHVPRPVSSLMTSCSDATQLWRREQCKLTYLDSRDLQQSHARNSVHVHVQVQLYNRVTCCQLFYARISSSNNDNFNRFINSNWNIMTHATIHYDYSVGLLCKKSAWIVTGNKRRIYLKRYMFSVKYNLRFTSKTIL